MPDISMVADCLICCKQSSPLALVHIKPFERLQDTRTWSVVWEVQQSCPVFGCCFLPGSANALAVCGPPSSISILDTAGDSSAGCQQHKPLHMLHESPSIADRHLLCVAATTDGTAVAASGTGASPPALEYAAPALANYTPYAPQDQQTAVLFAISCFKHQECACAQSSLPMFIFNGVL